jgi:hypothetical protein
MDLATQLERTREFLSFCPHPSKVIFRSMAKARKRAREIGGLLPYKCVCGKFHLTTDVKNPKEPECPICGSPIDERVSCGCFEDLHWGND